MDYDYDAIVVGAGTGGLSAGAHLKEAGMKYLIIDKKEEIGLPVRSTGAVSMEWVKKIGMPTEGSIVTSTISSVQFRTDRGKKIALTYDHPIGLVYDFTKYEKYLSEQFKGPLNLKMNTRVNSVSDHAVETQDGTFTSKYIIMAAGPQSSFGEKLDRNNVLVAYEEMRELPRRDDFEMNLWFSDLAPGGYFWDFADSENTRKIGVCFNPVTSARPSEVLKKFTEKFPEVKGKCLHTMAHQIPLARPLDSVVKENRMFVGDMVNAVLNSTAGGLQGAFWTGKAAGLAVASDNPVQYQDTWDMEIKPWLMKHHNLHRRMHKRGARSIGNLMTLGKLMPLSMKKRVFGGL